MSLPLGAGQDSNLGEDSGDGIPKSNRWNTHPAERAVGPDFKVDPSAAILQRSGQVQMPSCQEMHALVIRSFPPEVRMSLADIKPVDEDVHAIEKVQLTG
jgi:hypothetical protein